MTTVYVLNDTSTQDHAGCKAVMQSLYTRLEDSNVVGQHHVGTRLAEPGFNDADLVICNGEGTMHHDRPNAKYLIECLDAAQTQGRRTMLVNTVWQEMAGSPVLCECEQVTTREPWSAMGTGWGICYPDLCLDAVTPPSKPGPYAGERVLGDVGTSGLRRPWFELRRAHHNHLSLSKGATFQQVVDDLAGADLYVTGQHHGVYAAAIAGVPFRCCRSNSWKIEALLDWYEPGIDWPEDSVWFQRPKNWYAGFSEWLLSLSRMPMIEKVTDDA